MVADGRLVLREEGGEVADAERLALLDEQVEHPEASAVGDGLEPLGEALGAIGAERRRGSGQAARAFLPQGKFRGEGSGCHETILSVPSMFVNGVAK